MTWNVKEMEKTKVVEKVSRHYDVTPDVLVVLQQGVVVLLDLCTRHDRCALQQLMAFDAFYGHLGYHTERTESHLFMIRARRGEWASSLRTCHRHSLIERTGFLSSTTVIRAKLFLHASTKISY